MQSSTIVVGDQPCRLVEVERFNRHFACPEGAYIQRVHPVAASSGSDPVLQVTCVALAVVCDQRDDKGAAQGDSATNDKGATETTKAVGTD